VSDTNKIEGQEFICPHCKSITTATAELDLWGHHEGTIPLAIRDGLLVLDWDNADLDLDLVYTCDECGEKVACSISELEEMLRVYERDTND
jgi:transcription elongation factor Elf1